MSAYNMYKVEDLLPHAHPAILIDSVVNWLPQEVTASVTITPNSPFFVNGKGVPAHVGIEYMAQTCGVYSGILSKKNGVPIRMGFLLGTRNFQATVPWFSLGSTLIIQAKELFNHEMMGSFSCKIQLNGDNVATAELSVYQPDDPFPILK